VFFFMQIAVLLPLFPLALALVYRAELVQQLRARSSESARLKLGNEYQSSTTSAQ
jgi:hypothetical protein